MSRARHLCWNSVGELLGAYVGFGVGFVGSLFEPSDIHHRRFDAIERRAARMIAAVARSAPANGADTVESATAER